MASLFEAEMGVPNLAAPLTGSPAKAATPTDVPSVAKARARPVPIFEAVLWLPQNMVVELGLLYAIVLISNLDEGYG